MRSPDQYAIVDWQHYLFAAIERETGEPWKPPSYIVAGWTRKIKELLKAEFDSYDLALGIDLLAIHWVDTEQLTPYRVLSPGYLITMLQDIPRPLVLRRAVWFSRFAQTDDESWYYKYWLTQLESSLSTPAGVEGRGELLSKSIRKLADAEHIIRGRDAVATFKYHWLRSI